MSSDTPFHLKLWHRGFWCLALANLLLTLSVYLTIPLLGHWLPSVGASPSVLTAVVAGYGAGLFLLGPFCSYLVQRYRRNHVCQAACLLLSVSFWLFGVAIANRADWGVPLWTFAVLRIVMGALFGLAQMVLCSTLVIDVCESFQRTQANHAVAWFGRFALTLAPLTALLVMPPLSFEQLTWLMAGLSLLSVLLIQAVTVPFRAPSDDYRLFCADRFLLPSAWPLFLAQVAFCFSVGAVLAMPPTLLFYILTTAGFLLALVVERLYHTDDVRRWVVVAGLLLMLLSLHGLRSDGSWFALYVCPILFGLSTGLVGSCFLMFFVNMSNHCQRGTSQSTFFLAGEVGIVAGLSVGLASGPSDYVMLVAMPVLAVSALAFPLLIGPWYARHKKRKYQ